LKIPRHGKQHLPVGIPEADRIGAEGAGFRSILHGMNPERILIAAEAVGIGLAALRKAASYARERVVFRRPIGQNQAIAHPLARCWMELEAANLMVMKAAALCEAYHQPVSSHLFTETSCHLLAASPNGLIVEHMDWWEELYGEPIRLVDGHLVVPDRPGIGCEPDPRALARFRA